MPVNSSGSLVRRNLRLIRSENSERFTVSLSRKRSRCQSLLPTILKFDRVLFFSCEQVLNMSSQLFPDQALTIAGVDPCGFAGLTADLRTFGSLGVMGFSAATALTVQSPNVFESCEPVDPEVLQGQIRSILDSFGPCPVKIGLIPSPSVLACISDFIDFFSGHPVILDPILEASAGPGISSLDASALAEGLFNRCSMVTPNIPEAEQLTGGSILSRTDQADAARMIHDRYGCLVLLKGGHLEADGSLTDTLVSGGSITEFSRTSQPFGSIHGSGCFLSSAITAFTALGFELPLAVSMAEDYVTSAFSEPRSVGGHALLWPSS